MQRARRGALVTALLVVGAFAVAPATALAGAGLSGSVQFADAVVTVGDVNKVGSVTFTNANTPVPPPGDVGATICRHDDTAASTTFGQCVNQDPILFTPSCGRQGPGVACSGPVPGPSGIDPDVLLIEASAVGTGGACTGTNFTAVRVPGDQFGRYRFDPPGATHVFLPTPGDFCTISFEYSVLRVPTIDIRPAIAGVQTAQVVEVTEESNVGNLGAGQGTQTPLTVNQARPAITTLASPDITLGAGTLSDQATVTGLQSPIAGATVTFRLYAPGDLVCSGNPVFTDVRPLVLNGAGTVGTAQSGTYTPTVGGVYRWIATYSGDANNAGIAGPCGEATETRNVVIPPPPPVNPPPPPPGVTPPPPPPYICTPPPGPAPPGGRLCETPPEVCTPPPGPAPAGGELCARGTAAIRGKTGCANLPFNVVVSGRQISRVVFALDGRVVSNLSSPNSGSRYVYKVNPRTKRVGTHRIIARTTFRPQSGTRARVLRVAFSRCARRAQSPAFTG